MQWRKVCSLVSVDESRQSRKLTQNQHLLDRELLRLNYRAEGLKRNRNEEERKCQTQG
ncbi:hypothetical protein ALC60_10888 [Trachymyrmex zeteki]|uniref:Uncharacterized protein n=1 Tax=Mycetomoellerius zeteki TaxID=64791 RepID=A0A151WQ32_9HYME|nr:hypothetical protein ALC60_10888 [Trachymyrmex zeteki]